MQNLKQYQTERTGKRVTLKTLTTVNMSLDYEAWLRDSEVIRYLEVRHEPQNAAKIRDFVNEMLESSHNLLLGIFIDNGKKHIGNIKLGPVNWRYGRGDIGILIGDRGSWGKGYGTEAVQVMCAIAFEDLKLRRVHAGAYASNAASMRIFEKAGFVREGVQRAAWILDGKAEDNILMARLADD